MVAQPGVLRQHAFGSESLPHPGETSLFLRTLPNNHAVGYYTVADLNDCTCSTIPSE